MSGRKKILLILGGIILLLFAAVLLSGRFLSGKDLAEKPGEKEGKPAEEAPLSEDQYQAGVKEIFKDYEFFIRDNNPAAGRLADLKNKLLALRVPAKFKDLHLNLFFSMVRMENFLNQSSAEERKASEEMAEKIKKDYSWLN